MRLMGGFSLSRLPSSLATRSARAPWLELATPHMRRRARGGCIWPGVLERRRGAITDDHRRLIDGTEKMGGEKEKSGRKFTSDEAQSTVELRLVVAEHGQGRLAALPGAESGVGSLATGELWRA